MNFLNALAKWLFVGESAAESMEICHEILLLIIFQETSKQWAAKQTISRNQHRSILLNAVFCWSSINNSIHTYTTQIFHHSGYIEIDL